MLSVANGLPPFLERDTFQPLLPPLTYPNHDLFIGLWSIHRAVSLRLSLSYQYHWRRYCFASFRVPHECPNHGSIRIGMSECWADKTTRYVGQLQQVAQTPSVHYSSSWSSVVLAFSLRYPSPTALHIISVDVLSRTVNVSTNVVTTERLILKRGAASALPKWFPARMLGKTESWIYERSESDLDDRVLKVWTRNLDHKSVMDVREDLVIHERDSSNPLAG